MPFVETQNFASLRMASIFVIDIFLFLYYNYARVLGEKTMKGAPMKEPRIILFAFPVLCLLLPWAQARAQEQDSAIPIPTTFYQAIEEEAKAKDWTADASDELQRSVQDCYMNMADAIDNAVVVAPYNSNQDSISPLSIFISLISSMRSNDHSVLAGILLVGKTEGGKLLWSFVEQYDGRFYVYGECSS